MVSNPKEMIFFPRILSTPARQNNNFKQILQWRIQGRGSGARGGGGPAPPPPPALFLDQTETRRTEKIFFGDRRPPPPPLPHLSQGLDAQCIIPAVLFAMR